MDTINISRLAGSLHSELVSDILPFWIGKMTDHEQGGYFGQMDGNDHLVTDAPKGGILNARILWTFSAAYRVLKDPAYLEAADRSKDYIFKHFIDRDFGGTFWSLTCSGEPLDTKKQIYSEAFFIYALSEYYLATGDETCRNLAKELFGLIEKHSYDPDYGGYFEAYSRDWKLLEDLRLSEKDANEKKTMNTHLHVLEAYTNLFRIWKDERLERQLRNLIIVFLEKIIDPVTFHQNLFFDEQWNCKSSITSYGHDIECSWLLYEAAEVLGDDAIIRRAGKVCLKMADATGEGIQHDGSLINEKNNATGHTDDERHWWPQAEAVVGFYNAFEITGNTNYLARASNSYAYIMNHLVDREHGEWHWSIRADGSVNRTNDKAGFWKCPYHNGRMCLEIMRRSNYHT